MPQQKHKGADAPGILRASVLPSSTLHSVLLRGGQDFDHLVRVKGRGRRLFYFRAFQFAGRILINPFTLVGEAEEGAEVFAGWRRAKLCGLRALEIRERRPAFALNGNLQLWIAPQAL